jgi:hypothetical protein
MKKKKKMLGVQQGKKENMFNLLKYVTLYLLVPLSILLEYYIYIFFDSIIIDFLWLSYIPLNSKTTPKHFNSLLPT